MTAEILVVEDDTRMRELLTEILKGEGYSVTDASTGEEGMELLESKEYDLIITDLKMPDTDGISILRRAKQLYPETLVIVITAYGTVDSAITAMKSGAYDYIQKPFEPEELLFVVKKAIDYRNLMKENLRLSGALEFCSAEEIVGRSPSIMEIKRLIERVAPLDVTVLIEGETGTGKTLVARTIHRLSRRAQERFMSINCGALAEGILESELFGHEKGAFTGAIKEKKGIFEAGNRGTVFLDDINLASMNMQIKLLKAIEEGVITRVGSTKEIITDVRIIAASNVPLKKEVEEGRFRHDLYYRLKVFTLKIPPLRERKEDIPILAHHFLSKYNERFSKNIKGFTNEVMEMLVNHPWYGNVRELEYIIESAVVMETSDKITPASLPEEFRLSGDVQPPSRNRIMRLEDAEKELIKKALKLFNGRKTDAARSLGISPATLWRKIKRYNLS